MAEMAAAVRVRDPHFFGEEDQQLCRQATGEKYLKWVKDFVSKNKSMCVHLKKPSGADLWIEELENTKYNGDDDEVNAWGKFYLPEIVKMQVIGVVKGTSCPCDELVLMTCEDKKLYGYDGEELHLVASSFLELCDKTIEYPASKRYYNGEAFKDMTEEDWKKVKMSDVGRKLQEEHKKLVNETQSAFVSLIS
ncbi:uncharacterized protein LOC143413433 [Maylandia zebra]|uniref:uncharacterized protein LOC143413433 n=1 Tax=Maylandia zebra TaxID=106582 RepID=UPI00403D25B8